MKKSLTLETIKQSVLSTPAFKLKDGIDNNHQFIDLKAQFGFVPDVILIEKIRGRNNVMVVSALPRKLGEQVLAQAKGGGENGKPNSNESGSKNESGNVSKSKTGNESKNI